jgi:ribose/xylose/arabinose/galactoside ABC-type transport system permease subunit
MTPATTSLLASSTPAGASRWREVGRAHQRELGLLCLIVLVAAVASLLYPRAFPTFANLSAVLRNLSLDGVLAVGMTLLFVGGTFDLSVGGTFSMVGVLVGWLLNDQGLPVPLAMALGLVSGATAGAINGLIATKVRVNALIATLATMGIYRGIAVLVGGSGIAFLPAGFSAFGQTRWLGMQVPFWLMLALAALGHWALAHTRTFRQYYYIGNNARAAHLSGIRVDRLHVLAFTLMGTLAGLAGMTFAARIGTAVSTAGDGAELRVITAVILGGASLQGGKGTVLGSLAGVLFIALVNNVLIIASVSSYWQSIVVGLVLVGAVALDAVVNRRTRA